MFFLSLLFFTTITLDAAETQLSQLPFVVNVFASPTSTATSVAATETIATQQVEMSNDVHVEHYTTLKTYLEPIGKTLEQFPSLWEHFKQECTENQWNIIGGSLFLGYAILCYILIADNYYMSDGDLWSRWRYDQSLTSLCALAPATLHKDLVLTIQQRYLDPQNPTDNIKPLVQFIQEVEKEKTRLTAYCNRAEWLKRLKVCMILPINDTKIALAHTLLDRLNFVKNLFTTWASEYNWGTLK